MNDEYMEELLKDYIKVYLTIEDCKLLHRVLDRERELKELEEKGFDVTE